jgi:arsenite/tail-anchored protein-transporting ATPase
MRIVLFTGKGGVGKTTTASATAFGLADRGMKTLLLSTDTAHSLADAVGVPLGGVDPITADELTVLPGIEEVLALLAVRELALAGDWDALVVDCAPTAETLRLLALPEALTWYLQKVFPAHRRIAKGIRPIATLLGRGEVVPPDNLFEALLRLNDDLAGVRQLLGDPAITTVRLVLTPESVVAAEARRTFTALALYGYSVDLVVANRVFPSGEDEWRAGWARAQQVQLAGIRESFAGLPVRELPYRAAEPVGEQALREVARTLYGDGDPAELGPRRELLRVDADGGEFVLSMQLPLAVRSAVDVARAGDDLIVTVGGHRRVLTLPSVLRRCQVVAGDFDGAVLSVRFRPDRRLWPTEDGSETGG